MKKSEAESYFRAAQKAAEDAYAEGKSDEEVIKSAKRAATKEAIISNSGKPLLSALKYGGGSYLASKFIPKDLIRNQLVSAGVHNPELGRKITALCEKANKNAGKVGLLVGAATLAAKSPKIYKKVRTARLGAEINTEDRLKKTNKK